MAQYQDRFVSPVRKPGHLGRSLLTGLAGLATMLMLGAGVPLHAAIKWNPGHYVRIRGDYKPGSVTTSGSTLLQWNAAIAGANSAFKGAVIRVRWNQLESAMNDYTGVTAVLGPMLAWCASQTPQQRLIVEFRDRSYSEGPGPNFNDAVPAYFAANNLLLTGPTREERWDQIVDYGNPLWKDRYVALLQAIHSQYGGNPLLEGVKSGEQAPWGAPTGQSWFDNHDALAHEGTLVMPTTLFWPPLVGQMIGEPGTSEPTVSPNWRDTLLSPETACLYIIDSAPHEYPNLVDKWGRLAIYHPNEFPVQSSGEIASWNAADFLDPAAYYSVSQNYLHAHHVVWTYYTPSTNANWWTQVKGFLDNNGNGRPTNTTLPANLIGGPLAPPTAPAQLTATTVSSSEIALAWVDRSDNEAGFQLDRAFDAAFKSGVAQVTTPANATSYTSGGLDANTTYFFRARAVNAYGESHDSNLAHATTADGGPVGPLLLRWKFDELAGATVADSAGNHTGTLVGGPAPIAGRYGGGLNFTGANCVTTPNASDLHLTTTMTLATWVRMNTAADGWYPLVSKKNNGPGDAGYELQYNPAQARLRLRGGALAASGVVLGAAWHHVAVVLNGRAGAIYLDGVAVATDAGAEAPVPPAAQGGANTPFFSGGELRAGHTTYGGAGLDGALDELRIYNLALSPEQVELVMLNVSGLTNSVPAITTTSLPDGALGAAYSQTLSATGDDGALIWTLDSGDLPAGLSLSGAGVISGTPTAGGTFNFTVRVADSDGIAGPSDEDSRTFALTIATGPLPVLRWQLDEADGATTADSAGSHTGTLVNNPPRVAGQFGNGVNFTGSQHVSTPDAADLQITAKITLVTWVKMNTATTSKWFALISKKSTGFNGPGYELMYNPSGTGQIRVRGGGGSGQATNVALGTTWHHVAAVISGNTATIYVDGVNRTTATGVGTPSSSTAELRVGASSYGGGNLDGALDGVRIYNTALTATEVQALLADD